MNVSELEDFLRALQASIEEQNKLHEQSLLLHRRANAMINVLIAHHPEPNVVRAAIAEELEKFQ